MVNGGRNGQRLVGIDAHYDKVGPGRREASILKVCGADHLQVHGNEHGNPVDDRYHVDPISRAHASPYGMFRSNRDAHHSQSFMRAGLDERGSVDQPTCGDGAADYPTVQPFQFLPTHQPVESFEVSGNLNQPRLGGSEDRALSQRDIGNRDKNRGASVLKSEVVEPEGE